MARPPCSTARVNAYPPAAGRHHPWIGFNRMLDREARGPIDEARIEEWLETLARMDVDDGRIYWLIMARITELTLRQAGNYADDGEFQAAGDLLANPRTVDVYGRGWPTPVTKRRHTALSRQFATAIGDDDPVAWLTRETLTRIREAALLPHLFETLHGSGFMAPAYLFSLDRRMVQVAETLAGLAAWQARDGATLLRRMQAASASDRQLMEACCCRFGLDDFYAMGTDMEQMARGGGGSRFLAPHRRVAAHS